MHWLLLLAASAWVPDIPKVWTNDAVRELEVPLAKPEFSPKHISEADYYRIPERVIYRTYPSTTRIANLTATRSGSSGGSRKSPSTPRTSRRSRIGSPPAS